MLNSKVKTPSFFFEKYLQAFDKEYETALEDFSIEDKIHITDVLISTIKAYKQQPIDYEKAKTLHEGLLKKYGKQLRAYSNARISDYFQPESLKHAHLQYELKVDNAGTSENFFTEEERLQFLNRVEILLDLTKQQYYLLTDPLGKTEKEEDLSESTGKNKAFTARRRALAIHYLDKHFKINPTGNKLPLAEFAHFLTGNTQDKIYKVLRNPLAYNTDSVKKKAEETIWEDLKFIRLYFIRLELPEVVKFIDNDMDSIE